MKKPKYGKITDVITGYNGMKFLQDCLQSLQNQVSYVLEFKVPGVSNGPQDGSVKLVCEKFSQVYRRK